MTEPDNTGNKQSCTQFKKGQSGNPAGRPKGAKQKLSTDFINALAADFDRYGLYPISRVRNKDPAAYLRVIASVLPKEIHGNINHSINEIESLTIDEINEQLDELRAIASSLRAHDSGTSGVNSKAASKKQVH